MSVGIGSCPTSDKVAINGKFGLCSGRTRSRNINYFFRKLRLAAHSTHQFALVQEFIEQYTLKFNSNETSSIGIAHALKSSDALLRTIFGVKSYETESFTHGNVYERCMLVELVCNQTMYKCIRI